ncbi:unnamed protein product [Brachionus calyciflorus]|uniref:WAP domain-containing protein n=1 Tax=Brachionus calyciflorus TaxID=104777 RepID=A0A813V3B8_9BILA|nr:unnamed protein product [Brachionus calyciflorus]
MNNKLTFYLVLVGLLVISLEAKNNVKDGSCPLDIKSNYAGCTDFCLTDDQCPGNLKCCASDCGKVCVAAVPGVKTNKRKQKKNKV